MQPRVLPHSRRGCFVRFIDLGAAFASSQQGEASSGKRTLDTGESFLRIVRGNLSVCIQWRAERKRDNRSDETIDSPNRAIQEA